jgi:hypothetical protein
MENNIMKKLAKLTICLLLSSCLAETYQTDVFENLAPSAVPVAPIKSGVFNTSSKDNLLIIKLSGGRFVDSQNLSPSFFKLNDSDMTSGIISRDSDSQVTVSNIALTDRNDNRLSIAKDAFKTGATRVTVTPAEMGVWKSVVDTGFGSTDIWSAAYGNGRAVMVGGPESGGEGKIAYSSDGVIWKTLVSGLGEGQSQFQNTIRGVTFGGGEAGGRFVAVGYDGRMAVSGNGINWEGWWEANFSGSGGVLCVTYGGGTFVAGGGLGRIAWSKDGQVWSATDALFGQKSIMGLAYGETEKGGVFVAVGTKGQLAYSSDGRKWTYADAQLGHPTDDSDDGSSDINAVAFGAGVFVAVGNDGKMSYSRDGSTWTKIESGTTAGTTTFTTGILSIAYGSGAFVAVGHNGKMATSVDGVVWTGGSLSALSDANDGKIQTICYAGDKFIAGGNTYSGNTSKIAYGFGTPGVNTPLPIDELTSEPFNVADNGINTLVITFSGGTFIASPQITSFKLNGVPITNGTVTRNSGNQVTLSELTLNTGNQNYIQIAPEAQASRTSKTTRVTVAVSKNITWTKSNNDFGAHRFWTIANGANVYVAGGDGVFASSSNGATWASIVLTTSDNLGENQIYKTNYTIRGIAYGNGVFVAVGYQYTDNAYTALLLRSPNGGVSWYQTAWADTGFEDTSILSVCFGGDRFLIGGDSGKSAWSQDGQTWQFSDNTSFGGKSILSLAYGSGKFVAVGINGRAAWSTDGTIWHGETGGWISDDLFGDSADINTIVFANNLFVAGSSRGGVKTSTDGKNWSLPLNSKFDSAGVWGLAYANGKFIAVGDNGKTSESIDGTVWTAAPIGGGGSQFNNDEKIAAIATDGVKFVIIGNKYSDTQSKIAYSN